MPFTFTGDERTASDALAFILGFLERFPSYIGRPFWIAGESYGGNPFVDHPRHHR